ncbi:MAG: PBP1A family penicillin-binding protein [Deltaproteobacteria bacterium]|nr:PBP1A family penicillin-binding protein [Deltaproteobacteria bacterium]
MKDNTRRRIKLGIYAVLFSIVFGILSIFGIFIYLKSNLPSLENINDYQPYQVTKIYSDDGELVGELYKERRTVVPIEYIPRHVINAFLAAEDATFYEHEGLDYFGILRAAIKNLRPGAHLQGASTITQQTVKTLVVGPERSYVRKMREILLTRQIEQMLSKDDILYLYLNQIYFGAGAYGIEEAAKTYFGKSVRDLTIEEGAYLAAIPKNPSRYTLRANPKAAKQRQTYVLEQMQKNAWITAEELQKAQRAPITKPASTLRYLGVGPHYIEYVKKLLSEKYGEEEVLTQGLTVYIGMNARMQAAAHFAIRHGLEYLTRRQGYPGAALRIEVDKYSIYKKVLHEEFKSQLDKYEAYEGNNADSKKLIWDLSQIGAKTLADESKIAAAVQVVTLTEGQRVVALVDKVDAVKRKIWIDLGSIRASIDFKNLTWARRFSPTSTTPAPRVPSEVARIGDLVAVEIIAAPDIHTPKEKLELDLIPVPKAEAALIAIDPYSRLVRAIVGGYDENAGGLNRALQSKRQPGSSFKPIVYAAGLSEGVITPASICADTPILIRDPWTGKAWKPENYEDGRYDGNITYRTALMRSKNTCSVKLIEKVTPEKVIALAEAMGIESKLPENLTLALGTGDVRPIELANAYACIAAGGIYTPPVFIRKVVALDGSILEESQQEPVEVLSLAVAYVLTQMMRSVVESGTATKALVLDRPLVGKTGTSQQSRNVWFSGFSADLVATVWVGFDDNSPLGRVTGGSTALPIWIDFMGRALSRMPVKEFPQPPEDVVIVKVDPLTGQPSAASDAIEEAFVAGTEPTVKTQALPSIFIEDDTEEKY